MASLLLIRHGQASFGSDNYDRLSAVGERQAIRTRTFVQARWGSIARITCGTHERHWATARLILGSGGIANRDRSEIETDERLNELDADGQIAHYARDLCQQDPEFGHWLADMRSSSKLYQKVIQRVFAHWQSSATTAGIESWSSFSGRVVAALSDLMSQARSGETTVVVTSGGVIATIVQHVLGLQPQGTYPLFEAMKNCSLTEILHTSQKHSLSSFNETAHLVELGTHGGVSELVTYR
jgi:broad specificity phosphatase PhoE